MWAVHGRHEASQPIALRGCQGHQAGALQLQGVELRAAVDCQGLQLWRRDHHLFQLSAAGEGEGAQGSWGGQLDADSADAMAAVGSQLL